MQDAENGVVSPEYQAYLERRMEARREADNRIRQKMADILNSPEDRRYRIDPDPASTRVAGDAATTRASDAACHRKEARYEQHRQARRSASPEPSTSTSQLPRGQTPEPSRALPSTSTNRLPRVQTPPEPSAPPYQQATAPPEEDNAAFAPPPKPSVRMNCLFN